MVAIAPRLSTPAQVASKDVVGEQKKDRFEVKMLHADCYRVYDNGEQRFVGNATESKYTANQICRNLMGDKK